MDKIKILYNGAVIEVDKKVADYLESERCREQAEEKSDKRHLSDKDINRNDLNRFLSTQPEDFTDEIANYSEVAYLRKILSSLTETQLRRVKMYFFDGLTYRQIAVLENASDASIRENISAALKKIKKYF